MFGARGPTRCTAAPSDSNTAANPATNFGSRSMITRLELKPHSAIPIVALRACWATHAASGFAVGVRALAAADQLAVEALGGAIVTALALDNTSLCGGPEPRLRGAALSRRVARVSREWFT